MEQERVLNTILEAVAQMEREGYAFDHVLSTVTQIAGLMALSRFGRDAKKASAFLQLVFSEEALRELAPSIGNPTNLIM